MINVATLTLNTVVRRARAVPLSLVLLLLVVALFVSYIWQANGVATSIYRLDTMDEKKADALLRLERLDLQLTEFQSASVLSAAAIDLGLQQPDEVHYLSASSLDVAVVLPE